MLYSQIDVDLRELRGPITKAKIDRALERWPETDILGSIMILNGSIYLLRPYGKDGVTPTRRADQQLAATLRQIWEIARDPTLPKLPDLEMLINADDYGRVSVHDDPPLPLLSITKKKGRGLDILYPAGHYANAGKSVTAIGTDNHAYRVPWRRKNASVLFWRGRPNSHTLSRWALPRMALEGNPEQRAKFDIGLLWYFHAHDPFVKANRTVGPLPLLNELDMFRHSQYKYVVHLDGHSYSHRLIKLLSTNSLILKETTPDLEFYYHLLKPFEHYWPFEIKVPTPNYHHRVPALRQPRLDGVTTDLLDVMRAAELDDERARRIGEQAHRLAHTHLCDAARRCYLIELLRRYGEAMAYKPSLSDRPGAMLATSPQQLIEFARGRGRGVAWRGGRGGMRRGAKRGGGRRLRRL